MNVNAAMDAIGKVLGEIDGIRVYDYQAEQVAVPAAIVAFPKEITYDVTYAGGLDTAVFTVHVLVSKSSDRAGRDALSDYLAGNGPKSIKAKLEEDPTLLGSVQTMAVNKASISTMEVAAVSYLGASFDVEVWS